MSAEEPDVIDAPSSWTARASRRRRSPSATRRRCRGGSLPRGSRVYPTVFTQVREVGLPGRRHHAARKALAGLDKKMQFLRDKVGSLSGTGARRVCLVHQATQVNLVDQIIAAKEGGASYRRSALRANEGSGDRAATQSHAELDALRSKLNDLEAHQEWSRGQLNRTRTESEQTIGRTQPSSPRRSKRRTT